MSALPHAVIIAGGKGERLGTVRKAELTIGGERLLDRVTAALGDVSRPLMLSLGTDGQPRRLDSNFLVVRDAPERAIGPLAALVAAVQSLADRGIVKGLLVSVTVDTPFLPDDFIALMNQGLGDSPAAFAAWGDNFYPPNAIWQISALQRLPERVAQNDAPQSCKSLHRELGSVRVDWQNRRNPDPFANLNTLKDLINLAKRAKG